MKNHNLDELPLRTKEKQEFSNRKILRDTKTNFVHFVGLIKAVYKNDFEGKNSSRFWERLKPELDKKDCKKIDDELFISPEALNKFVSKNATACKKTWGSFYDDGLELMLHELGYKKRRLPLSSPGGGAIAQKTAAGQSSRTPKSPEERPPLESSTRSLQEGLLNAREKNLNDQEALIAQRVAILSERERLCAEKEEHIEKKQQELQKLQKRLNKKEQEVSAPEMMKFVEQVSSLANKFKAKASRSRRNSSEEPMLERSLTPHDVSDNENDKDDDANNNSNSNSNSNNNSRSMSRSPSPIMGSPEDKEVSGL
jgi:hypothetical protein